MMTRSPLRLCYLLALCLPALVPTQARAATLTVTSAADSGAGTLRAAITTANADGGDDTIVFAGGVTSITLTSGELDVIAPMTVDGPGVTVSGNNASTVFKVGGGTSSQPVTLSGLTITGGNPANGIGSGVVVDSGAVAALTGCTLTQNSAENGGGLNNAGTAALTGCTLTGNTAYGGSGGGLNNGGTLTLTDCTLTQNSTVGNSGGGGLENGGTATLTACALTGNTAYDGGGLENGGTLTLTGCTLTQNSGSSGGGGLENYGTATLTGCTLAQNSGGFGGGLGNAGTATLNLTACALNGNSGSYGGGLNNGGAATLTLTACALTGNSASDTGGGLLNDGTATLTACALAQNSGGFGGGLYNGGTATLTGCTLTGNSALDGGGGLANSNSSGNGTALLTDDILYGDTGGEIANFQGSPTATYCDVGESLGTGTGGDGVTDDGHNFDADPEFVKAASPYDLRLRAGSRCIGTGDPALAGTQDITGATRPYPPSVGAYEEVVAYPTANPQTVNVPFNTRTSITLTGSDPNSPAQALTYSIVSPPAYGHLAGTAPDLTYTPNGDFQGTDSFTFTVTNASGLTSPAATVTLNVAAGTPTATPQNVTVDEESSARVTLSGTDPDRPPLPLTYAYTQPAHGALSGTAPYLTYTPDPGYSGPDGFSFTVSNGTRTSAPANVSITVRQVVVAVTGVSATWGSRTAALGTGGSLLPAGRSTDVPWLGVSSFTLTLSAAQPFAASDVSVKGVSVADYGPVTVSGSGTSYTVTLARPVRAADRVTLRVSSAGVRHFSGTLPVLPGDISGDGAVNASDLVLARNDIGTTNAYADINGDGSVDVNDYTLVRQRIGTRLP